MDAKMFSSHVGEIKAKGVEEAARDPASNVNSDDVQKVLADESKKAGVAAYRFDPNASPEEKAASAAAVCSQHMFMTQLKLTVKPECSCWFPPHEKARRHGRCY